MENIELVNDIFEEAFEWEADDRVFFEIERNGNSTFRRTSQWNSRAERYSVP